MKKNVLGLLFVVIVSLFIYLFMTEQRNNTVETASFSSAGTGAEMEVDTSDTSSEPPNRVNEIEDDLPKILRKNTSEPNILTPKTKTARVAFLLQKLRTGILLSEAARKNMLMHLLHWGEKTGQDAILKLFEEQKTRKPWGRTQLRYYAKRINGPKLRPMWESLITRKELSDSVEFPADDKHFEATAAQRAIGTEKIAAVEALVELSITDRRSRNFLLSVVASDKFSKFDQNNIRLLMRRPQRGSK